MSVSAADTPAPPARPRRSSGEQHVVRCEGMVHGGACLAHLDGGETILVDGAIPGELVRARLSHRRGGTWFAAVDEVVEASPHRTAPPCPYVPECGGCQLQHIDYAHQLELKRGIVLDAMRRQSVPIPDAAAVHGMDDPWRYRWRGEFHVIAGTEGMAAAGLGFKRARSWSTIAVEDCLIHHRAIARSLPALRQAVRRGGSPGLTALHLTAGEDGSEVLVKPRPPRQLDASAVDAAATTLPAGLRWNTDSTTLRWRGYTIRVRAETFIQVNQMQMEVLYGLVLGRLGDLHGARVVDAYAGIGMLSLAIAESAAEVVCIEENRVAARLGMLNAEMNDAAARVRYLAVPVEEGLPMAAVQGRIDAVVLDPPRAGCAGSVVGWLALAGPPRVVYLSCDPATMARDLHILAASGPYAVEELDVVDMFPHTHHVEMVASLRRRE